MIIINDLESIMPLVTQGLDKTLNEMNDKLHDIIMDIPMDIQSFGNVFGTDGAQQSGMSASGEIYEKNDIVYDGYQRNGTTYQGWGALETDQLAQMLESGVSSTYAPDDGSGNVYRGYPGTGYWSEFESWAESNAERIMRRNIPKA